MKDIHEMVKGLGPVRARDLTLAYEAAMAAKVKLDELQKQLQASKQGQTMHEPAALIGVGAGVAELAKGMQLHGAHNTMAVHLEQEAIPAARAELQRASYTLSRLQDAHSSKHRFIETQRAIIDKAQAEIERATAWLDT